MIDILREQVYLATLLYGVKKFETLNGKNTEPLSNPLSIDSEFFYSEGKNLIEEASMLSLGGKDCSSNPSICMNSLLESIDPVQTAENPKVGAKKQVPAVKLCLSKKCFPKANPGKPDYQSLYGDFLAEYKTINSDSFKAFSETLLSLLFKYTVNVPAGEGELQDISLYDHIKTTAAIAVCLYDFNRSADDKAKAPFLLTGGDFSGIQSYIYQIVSKYAGKNLKGRSFYLNLLSDSVVRYLLKELELFQSNIVYNSGGSFYLLSPNTASHKAKLEACIKHIESQFFSSFGTSLFVAVDSVELSKNCLLQRGEESLGKLWGELFEKRDKKKNSRYSKLIESGYEDFFEPIMSGGEAKSDTITGEEFAPGEKAIKKDELILKEITAQQIDLGKKLRESELIVIKEGEPLDFWRGEGLQPAGLGFEYYLLTEEEFKNKQADLNRRGDLITILTLNNSKRTDCNFLYEGKNIYGLKFYGGRKFDSKDTITFEEMCDNPNFSKLGVLRMDVDNLGRVFQKGIPAHKASLSRFATLSRSFDFFFSGYLNTIWEETAPEKSFIIYSGGDDVFIVGSWDTTIELAEKIREDFREYTCCNKAFSLSGGIAIMAPKYPIMKGAEESAEEEENAKGHSVKGMEKNSISFLKTALNWDCEYHPVEKLKKKLVDLLSEGRLPKSFLSKIMSHAANAGIENHKIRNYKIYWLLTYDMHRMKERYKNDEAVKSLTDSCIKEVCDQACGTLNGEEIATDYHPLELWAFASRWAELEYRSNKN